MRAVSGNSPPVSRTCAVRDRFPAGQLGSVTELQDHFATAPKPAGKARATSIPGAVGKERATPLLRTGDRRNELLFWVETCLTPARFYPSVLLGSKWKMRCRAGNCRMESENHGSRAGRSCAWRLGSDPRFPLRRLCHPNSHRLTERGDHYKLMCISMCIIIRRERWQQHAAPSC